ncbi:MAG: sulfatase-like hydrolase/transferase, partial [candidate division Zixibacteria bacterium]|nr:sulfatase-like hydrolase/transferase [candidate division Zixibacteria bacterium]
MPRPAQLRTPILHHLLPSRPFLFILVLYILGLLLFAAGRLLFLFSFTGQWADVALLDILRAFLIGLRFDQIIVFYILTPVLLFVPWFKLKSGAVRKWTLLYLTALFSFCIFLTLADIRFYAYFTSHLNFLALDYLDEGPTAWNLILADPKFFLFIGLWAVVSVLFFFLLTKILKTTHVFFERRSWLNHVAYFLVFAALFALGIRGRTGMAAISWSNAYVSQHPFVNQLPLNGIYTLAQSLYEKDNDPRLIYRSDAERGFALVDFGEGLRFVQEMLYQEGDEWLEPEASLLRQVRQEKSALGYKPNIVMVVMESWSGQHTSCLGAPNDLTPHFDSLASGGILFTDFYGTGIRSNYGLGGILCGFPSLPGRAIMKRYQAAHPFITLPEILHERGYYNAFVYGGDPAFDNMEGFFTSKGFDRFYGDTYFGQDRYFSKWGIPDHVLFDLAVPLIDSLARPFQATIFTLSHHAPFDLPDSSIQRFSDNSLQSRIYNTQLYADYSVGSFVDKFRGKPVFDSTIFVFVSDHADLNSGPYMMNLFNFHIPLLIYAPGIIGTEGMLRRTVASQTDIIPTLMHLLGAD